MNPYEKYKDLREQHKIVAKRLVGYEFDSILEVGCGWAENLMGIRDLHPDKKMVGVDKTEGVVKDAKIATGLDIRIGNVLHLDFKDNEFDVVFTNALFCMLEIEDVEQALEEVIRVAKKRIIFVELNEKTEFPAFAINTEGRVAVNWVELFKKYGLVSMKEKISTEIWDAEPWKKYGYIIDVNLDAKA